MVWAVLRLGVVWASWAWYGRGFSDRNISNYSENSKVFSKNGSFCWFFGEFLFSLLMRFVLFIVIIIIIEHFVSVPVSWRDAGCT